MYTYTYALTRHPSLYMHISRKNWDSAGHAGFFTNPLKLFRNSPFSAGQSAGQQTMKIDPKFMYCVFAHVTDEGIVHISHGHISAAFNPVFKIYGVVPFTVEIMSTHPTLAEAAIAMPQKPRKSSSVPVQCVETGGVYASASAAARACGAHPSNMTTHLAGGVPRKLKGYSFRRVEGYVGDTGNTPLPPRKETPAPRHILTTEEVLAARDRIIGRGRVG